MTIRLFRTCMILMSLIIPLSGCGFKESESNSSGANDSIEYEPNVESESGEGVLFRLKNINPNPICYLYLVSSNASDWGKDQLGDGAVRPNGTALLQGFFE